MSVSVIIPALNAGNFISKAVKSALAQGRLLHEVIVVDDGSTDNTAEVIERLAKHDKRVTLIKLPYNQGPGPARNVAIAAATGAWIGILDADDSFLPGRLEYLVENAERYSLDYAADNMMFFDAMANQVSGLGVAENSIGSILMVSLYDYVSNCMTNRRGRIDFGLLQPLVRREFILANRLLYPSVRHGEDFAFYLKGLLAGGVFALFPGAYYLCTERTGRISGKPSGLSRTLVNYAALERFTLELASQPDIHGDKRLAGLLCRRARRLGDLSIRKELQMCWHDHRYRALAAQLHHDARTFSVFIGMIKEKACYHLFRTKY